MANREYWEVAARLNRLYLQENPPASTPLQISHDDLCRLGGVKNLKSPRVIGVAKILLRAAWRRQCLRPFRHEAKVPFPDDGGRVAVLLQE